jgi:hypothetical protein
MFPVHMQLPSALPERFIGSKFIDWGNLCSTISWLSSEVNRDKSSKYDKEYIYWKDFVQESN